MVKVGKQLAFDLLAGMRGDTRCRAARAASFDPYATAARFDGWSRAFDNTAHFDLPVDRPTRWLLTTGWRRHGRIDPLEVPGCFLAESTTRDRIRRAAS